MRDQDQKILTRRDALVALAASGATLAGCAHPALAKSAPPTSSSMPPSTASAASEATLQWH